MYVTHVVHVHAYPVEMLGVGRNSGTREEDLFFFMKERDYWGVTPSSENGGHNAPRDGAVSNMVVL